MTNPLLPEELEALEKVAREASPGPWERMKGRELVRAIRGDLAVPLFQTEEPYSDPMLGAPTCRVGKEVVFRANSQAARESAAMKQACRNAEYLAAFDPPTVLRLIDQLKAKSGEPTGEWVLVPRIATDRMLLEGAHAGNADISEVWAAMIAAAPTPKTVSREDVARELYTRFKLRAQRRAVLDCAIPSAYATGKFEDLPESFARDFFEDADSIISLIQKEVSLEK